MKSNSHVGSSIEKVFIFAFLCVIVFVLLGKMSKKLPFLIPYTLTLSAQILIRDWISLIYIFSFKVESAQDQLLRERRPLALVKKADKYKIALPQSL